MTTIKIVCILLCINCYFQVYGADKYTDENRPYEFGFTIDGEQHRHEKKDENGIIMGEFGFITADGVYHVTVYATDENGNFKILSMKNIRVKPYPTGPGVGERKSPTIHMKQNQSAMYSAPSAGTRQAHSISLPPTQQALSNNKQQLNVENKAGIARSCSHCKVPTTTSAPKIEPIEQKQISQDNFARPELSLKNPFPNQFSPQNPKLNIPSVSVDSNQQTYANHNHDNPSESINNNRNSVNQQPNTVKGPIAPISAQYDNNESSAPTSSQYSNGKSNFQPNLYTRQNIKQSYDPELASPKSIEEANVQQLQGGLVSDQINIPNINLQSPKIDQNDALSNAGESNPIDSKEYTNGPKYNEQSQKNVNVDSPSATPNGYRQPKSFEEILQSASPNPSLSESFQPNVAQTPGKPVLIAAQMQIVDKNADIYHKNPGEIEGLPKGLNTGDMTALLYTFNYTVGFHGHHEKGYTNGVKIGYYYVTGRNGVRTRVDYVADEKGFRPKISQEVLNILSDDVPKPETEKDEKYGLKGYEFKWLYYPVESRKR